MTGSQPSARPGEPTLRYWTDLSPAWTETPERSGTGEGMERQPEVNILLVDDQPSNLLALEAILDGEGLNLVRALSGSEALMRVLDDDFAVILMDVQMPGMDGFETAELIRQRDRSRHTPFLFLTAYQSSDEQIQRGYALGAVDFLSKPVVSTVLRSKVAVFVELFLKNEQVKRQAAHLVESHRQAHVRALAEEKARWEMERLREEAAKEKRSAEELAQRALELTRTIDEKVRAQEQLKHRAAQQAVVAGLGQRALSGTNLDQLLCEAAGAIASSLSVGFVEVMELNADGHSFVPRATVGEHGNISLAGAAAAGAGWLAGLALQSSEPVVVEDIRDDSRFEVLDPLGRQGMISGVSVVITGRDQPFGTIGVFSDQPRTFSQDDVHFLQAVANVLAAAIERQRDQDALGEVRDELARQLADMTTLHALSERLSNKIELTDVLQEVLSAVVGLHGAERGVLMLHDRDRGLMRTAAVLGLSSELLKHSQTTVTEWNSSNSRISPGNAEGQEPDVSPQPIQAPWVAVPSIEGLEEVLKIPLLIPGGDPVGLVALYDSEPRSPSARQTRLVELYVRQAAEFIDNARLYGQIRDADRRKGEFLAMLGHELRNPLAPILNALHVMRMPNVDQPSIYAARDIAERQVKHLARLVDDLLDLSRIDSGKIELRKGRVDLREAVSRAVETTRPLIESRRHSLSVTLPDDPLPLEGDAARLEQVLSNLLNNAAKYTEPGGKLDLTVERQNGRFLVKVRDNGIGIAPELLPRVFDLFTQADCSLDRSQGGLGIGLTLVRSLVEMHGGRVAAHSEGTGRGSEFLIVLPAATPESAGPATDSPDPSSPRPRPATPGLAACFWSMTMSTAPRFWPRCCGPAATSLIWPTTALRPWKSPG